MDDFRLTDKQIAALRVFHRAQRDKRLAYRLNAIILLGTGWSTAQVAEALLVDEKTIRLWLEKYRQGGTDDLLELKYEGKESKLNETQQQELVQHLEKNTYLTSKEIRHYIKKKYKVAYSPTGVKELLGRLGFVYKKPKHVPGKLDRAAQKAFLSKYRRLRKTKGKNDPIYFADACHPQYNSMPAYGRIRRGQERHLKSTGSRKRVNIHGAVNIATKGIVTDFAKSITSESSLRLFKKMEARHPKAKAIPVIVDNASYYISRWLRIS
jgi:transposase